MFATKLKEYAAELKEEGREEGAYKKALEDAQRMLELGADIEFIHKVTGLSIETIEGLKNS